MRGGVFAVRMIRNWWEGLVHASYMVFGGGVRGKKGGNENVSNI